MVEDFIQQRPLCGPWLQSRFHQIGGLYHSLLFDSHAKRNPFRSHAFYYIFSAFYVAELVASYLASKTIDITPWIPFGMAFGSVIIGLLLLWIMPSPKKHDQKLPISSESITAEDETSSGDDHVKISLVTDIRNSLTHRNVIFAIPVFLVGTLRYTTLNVLIQYSWVRFKFPISKGAAYYTETAVVNIFLFLFFIPRMTAYIRVKYNIRPQVIDLFLVRTSVTLLFLGSLSIGLAPSSRLIPIGKTLCSHT